MNDPASTSEISGSPVLKEAAFDPRTTKYYMASTCIPLACTIVLLPAVPFILLGIALLHPQILKRMSAELTTTKLEVRKGWLNRVETAIPLEKITDLAYYQGPIMRWIGVEGLRVETAGQSGPAGGSLVSLVGVKETQKFRAAVLAQRDKVTEREHAPNAPTPQNDDAVLVEIRDALLRIEDKLGQG